MNLLVDRLVLMVSLMLRAFRSYLKEHFYVWLDKGENCYKTFERFRRWKIVLSAYD